MEGKVCLSLLGTWQGPWGEPEVSTLSQVLLAIQSQIMVDKPYFNEPSYESLHGTRDGDVNVAKHNMRIRLATLRYGIHAALRSPPLGFERATAAHFYYKRGELRQQLAQWVAEARALAVYDAAVCSAPVTVAAYTTALNTELAAAAAKAPAPAAAGAKRGRGSRSHQVVDPITHAAIPATFVPSAALTAMRASLQPSPAAASWTAAAGFEVFSSTAVTHMPRAPADALMAGTGAALPVKSAARSTATYASLQDLALATIAAADDIQKLLDTLRPPADDV